MLEVYKRIMLQPSLKMLAVYERTNHAVVANWRVSENHLTLTHYYPCGHWCYADMITKGCCRCTYVSWEHSHLYACTLCARR